MCLAVKWQSPDARAPGPSLWRRWRFMVSPRWHGRVVRTARTPRPSAAASLRLVSLDAKAAADHLAGLGDRADVAGRRRPASASCRWPWPRPVRPRHAALAGVGRGLAKLPVLACRRRRCGSSRSARRSVPPASPTPADSAGARLSSAQRTTRRRPPARAWPVLRQYSRIASGMSAGARNAASSGSMNDASGCAAAAKPVQIVPAIVRARLVPDAAALLHQPQAGRCSSAAESCRPRPLRW